MRWLLVDGTWLAHTLKYGMTQAGSIEESPEFISLGYLDALRRLCCNRRVQTTNVQLFFDSKKSWRRNIFPEYKSSRRDKEYTDDERRADAIFWAHIDRMIEHDLPSLGLPVYLIPGYEGDDLIASACRSIKPTDHAMIITADGDMWQCLDHHISWFNPYNDRYVTAMSFWQERGLEPKQWATVKAIAGCSGDSVPGIRGVGEVSAIKYLQGTLSSSSVYAKRINSDKGACEQTIAYRLVRLPYEGTPMLPLVPAKWSRKDFDRLVDERGWGIFMTDHARWEWLSVFGSISLLDRQQTRRPRAHV